MTVKQDKIDLQPEAARKSRSTARDSHIGLRLKLRRSMMGMTQEALADAAGITFQQIQKYEQGSNRISAGRLGEFSRILDVPVQFFYDHYEDAASAPPPGFSDNAQAPFEDAKLMYDKETIDLVFIYYSVKDREKRKVLLNTIRAMAETLSHS